MSYNYRVLLNQITSELDRSPTVSLTGLSRALRVSPRTIENTIKTILHKDFRAFRQDLLAQNIYRLLKDETLSIKEISFAAGYLSPRSFARAVRRFFGLSPTQLRSDGPKAPPSQTERA